uniref:EGF-like domain-containing protein n=1 Tax=Globodera pallida TaxID=36090 RepID=A0A183BNB9_GLOPA
MCSGSNLKLRSQVMCSGANLKLRSQVMCSGASLKLRSQVPGSSLGVNADVQKGAFDSEDNGGTRNEECYDYDKYCYIASCAKGNELVRTEWDCSPDSDCTEISAKVGESVGSKVTCECHFGRVNTSLTNENFTRPLLPTTTTDKPTTTMDKPTTTTDKPTNTTAEANLGVRAIIPVGSGVLLAIVHVFAFVLPKLGVGGQFFNDM